MDPVRLFYCYADKDEPLREKLDKHLASLRLLGVIGDWHRRRIVPGQLSEQENERHLDEAEIILLLISPDFFASDHCTSGEMQKALLRHEAGAVRILPILLKPTYWSGSAISTLACLPNNGKPITEWRNRDKAWVNVVRGIHAIAQELSTNRRRGVTWEVRLGAQLSDVNRERAMQLLAQLKELAQDSNLSVRAVVDGSVRLIMKGSFAGFRRVIDLVTDGKLPQLGGLPLLSARRLRSVFWIFVSVWLYSLAKLIGIPQRGYFPALSNWLVATITALALAGSALTAVATNRLLDMTKWQLPSRSQDAGISSTLRDGGAADQERPLPQPERSAVSDGSDAGSRGADLSASNSPPSSVQIDKPNPKVQPPATPKPGPKDPRLSAPVVKCPDSKTGAQRLALSQAMIQQKIDERQERLQACWASAGSNKPGAVTITVDCDGGIGIRMDEKPGLATIGDCIMESLAGIRFRRPTFEQTLLYKPPAAPD